jgi:hypothetical protein
VERHSLAFVVVGNQLGGFELLAFAVWQTADNSEGNIFEVL